MVRKIKKVTKNHPTRERKKIIVVGTEGNNKTETLYLRNLEKTQETYHFIFASGNETDPVKILKNTIKTAKAEEISSRRGDLAISIFDLDLDNSKKDQLSQAKELSARNNIVIVTSNPCFEVWYLEHFGFTSKSFNSNSELIEELKNHIPKYHKNTCDFALLYPLTNDAIKNCERLDEYHRFNSSEEVHEFNNPRTDVYKLIELITDFKNRKK